MPYNTKIPGQVTEYQLRAIEVVAPLISVNGKMVEVGSLFGASSWAWAKSVHPSVTVYCLDPWRGNAGIRPLERRLNIKYGLEQFIEYTKDCPNIVPKQGFSPRDFLDWRESIDLYYEDAVHTDPILSENLDFWKTHIKPNGIICGDDFRGRFPDVRNGAKRLAQEFDRELINVEHFWCLLPEAQPESAVGQVAKQLRAFANQYHKEMVARGPHAQLALTRKTDAEGNAYHFEVTLVQLGVISWPKVPSAEPLTVRLDILESSQSETVSESFSIKLDRVHCLVPDIPHKFELNAAMPALLGGKHARVVARSVEGDEFLIAEKRL